MVDTITTPLFVVEEVEFRRLKPHPRNYREHPDDQIEHIITSIREHGFYRNVVIARDDTILAGHGVVKASLRMGVERGPAIRLNLDPDEPRALKVLTGDNEMEHLAEQDDRLLSEILREIKEQDEQGLMGTGFDEKMLANLVFITRPKSEISTFNEAAHWVGMPEYGEVTEPFKVVINFETEEDRNEFISTYNIKMKSSSKRGNTWSTVWPYRDNDDLSSVRFKG